MHIMNALQLVLCVFWVRFKRTCFAERHSPEYLVNGSTCWKQIKLLCSEGAVYSSVPACYFWMHVTFYNEL